MTKFSSKRPLTNEEEAEIQKMIASDPDAPELTDEQIARAKPFKDALPAMAAKKAGRPRLDNPKQAISIRLDRVVIEKFRATGKGWQTRMNDALKRAKV